MNESALRAVAEQVLHRAQAHGFVVPRDIRADLSQAGFADTRWKEVLALVQARLRYRHGRYYYVSSVATHMRGRAEREHRQHDLVHQVVRRVIEQVRPGPFSPNRRRHRRVALGCSVLVLTEDHRELRLLCNDISLGGIRLVSTEGLENQTLFLRFAETSEALRVRILWGLEAGDGLFLHGGAFLDVAAKTDWLKIVQ